MPYIRYFLIILFICLVQALVLNHIHLLHCATPLLIVYPLMLLPSDMPKWSLPCIGFIIGLVNDMFTNTPGMGAASLTAVAMLRPYVLDRCIQRDDEEAFLPSRKLLGNTSYLLYATLLIGSFCLLYFTLEAFSFFHWLQWLGSIIGSTLFTLALVMAIESVRS